MNVRVKCPNCRQPIGLTIPAINPSLSKLDGFLFTCPMCGEKAIIEIQFSVNDKDFVDINTPPNNPNCKCQLLPPGIKDKIDKIAMPPEVKEVNGQPIAWISYKLGFTRLEKKHLES